MHPHGLLLFAHVFGFVLWLGGGMASMVVGVTAKNFAPDERLSAYRATGKVQTRLVGPGALLVVLSGGMLMMNSAYMQGGPPPGWLSLMMLCGIIAAVITLAVTMPAASRLARLELDPRGELPEAFHGLRKRMVIFATIAGSLGLLALLAGTFFRY
jgi:hypothetical protein